MHSGDVNQLINITTEGGGNLLAPVCQQTSSQHQRTPPFNRYTSELRYWSFLMEERKDERDEREIFL